MSDQKATPGPWRVTGVSMDTGSISVGCPAQRIVIADVTNAASFGDFVASAMRGRRDFGAQDTAHTQWANARLIAAAPALRDATQDLLRMVEAAHRQLGMWVQDNPRIAKARLALSQANGGEG